MVHYGINKLIETFFSRIPSFYNDEIASTNYKFAKSFLLNCKKALDNFETFDSDDNLISGLKSAIFISTAENSELDDIGELFKLRRQSGESDDNFRARILSFWSGAAGGGTQEDIKSAIAGVVQVSSDDITINEQRALLFQTIISINESTPLDALGQIENTITQSKAAGTIHVGAKLISQGGIFRSNLSDSNGGDTLL